MEEEISEVLQQLLSAGSANASSEINIAEINKKLGIMSFEAVRVPHSNVIVLKDLSSFQKVTSPWSEENVRRAYEIFYKIAKAEHIEKSLPVVDLLLKNNWIYQDIKGNWHLTQRSLIQFSEMIASFQGKYKKCELCSFLTDEGDVHKECSETLKNI